MKRQRTIAACVAMGLAVPLAACASSAGGDPGVEQVEWWTWDDKQAVSYEKCAELFNEEHEDIQVNVSQFAWDDYWTKITAGFVAGTAPDAFQNHTAYYPEYVDQGQILPLDDLIAENDFDMDKFSVGTGTWTYTDGHVYGLPMDWATIAFYYNTEMAEEAGLTAEDMDSLTWNPEDGGTFEDAIAAMTIDTNGVRGNEPGFDPDSIEVYGLGEIAAGGVNGQDTWAQFASTTGWTLGNEPNWPTSFNYSDPEFIDTMLYIRGLSEKGYAPESGEFTLGSVEQLGSGSAAMVSAGSWYANDFFSLDGVDVAIAPSVIGPSGGRSSLTASNANSIWANSPRVDAAWEWLEFMGSTDCQSVAGKDGTFFPSIEESMEVTKAAMLERGIDITPYVDQFTDGTLFSSPMYKNGQELDAAINPLMESFWIFERDEDVFPEMDQLSQDILAD
jgi:ABC-type glycerol-3-phosphate transport system substrate-binding protein